MTFRILPVEFEAVPAPNPPHLGIVKVQMQDQLATDHSLRVREDARDQNRLIVETTLARFGKWANQTATPAVILFPELSVTEESAAWLDAAAATEMVSPNTMIVAGLELLSVARFQELVAACESREHFAGHDYGVNVEWVNSAVVIVKDGTGLVRRYYQPKCSCSDWEGRRQYISRTIYLFTFAGLRTVVSICSDMFLRVGGTAVTAAVAEDLDALSSNPAGESLDLVLLIQKNPAPIHPLYSETIETLFYNQPHRTRTRDTIVCAVNSCTADDPCQYGQSNVSVMQRGRPPAQFSDRVSSPEFAWITLPPYRVTGSANLHLVRWRLEEPGVISFVLDTHTRPWAAGEQDSMPVRQMALFRITAAGYEAITPVAELQEMIRTIAREYPLFVEQVVSSSALRPFLAARAGYTAALKRIFAHNCPAFIFRLLTLSPPNRNCDLWKPEALRAPFLRAALIVRVLAESFTDLSFTDGNLKTAERTIGLFDGDGQFPPSALKALRDRVGEFMELDYVILQRVGVAAEFWDGAPIHTAELLEKISYCGVPRTRSPGSITDVQSPRVVDAVHLIEQINRGATAPEEIKGILHGILQLG